MITIKDIAKEAQVSEGTVDRVIHNRGGVSKKTAAKVRGILERHNFTVNPVASALAMKKKHQISVLIPEYTEADLFWKSPYLGVLKAADDIKSFGVQVHSFTFNQSDSDSYLSAFKVLLKTEPSAVIMVPNLSEETTQIINQLETLKIPYLFLNIDINGYNNMSYVGQDSYTAGYIAAKLLHRQAQETSEFLIIQSRHNSTKNNAISDRVEGFKNYFIENKIKVQPQILKIDNIANTENSREIIKAYLDSHLQIKVVFVPSSRIYRVVNCMDKKRLKQLELVGFDNTPQNTACLLNDSVSFLISQKPFDQGYTAVRLLTDYLIEKKQPAEKIYLPIDILIKENVQYNGRDEYISESEPSAQYVKE